MSDIATIRVIIRDTLLYAKEQITVDGLQLSLQLYFFPVVEGTVIITGDTVPAFTLDEDNGVLTFDSAPGAQELTIEYKHVSLLDAAIQVMLDLNVDSDEQIRLTAADCLDAIAREQALILKKIKLLDLETDGPALAKELRASAKSLRDQVFSEDLTESTFDIIEQVYNKFGYREKILKDIMKESL